MKITTTYLRQVIKEEIEKKLEEAGRPSIAVDPIKGKIGVRSLIEKSLEIISSQPAGISYDELEYWLFQNHNVGDDDWISGIIAHALESRQLAKYYDEETHSFSSR